jgi:hypothetical protein
MTLKLSLTPHDRLYRLHYWLTLNSLLKCQSVYPLCTGVFWAQQAYATMCHKTCLYSSTTFLCFFCKRKKKLQKNVFLLLLDRIFYEYQWWNWLIMLFHLSKYLLLFFQMAYQLLKDNFLSVFVSTVVWIQSFAFWQKNQCIP